MKKQFNINLIVFVRLFYESKQARNIYAENKRYNEIFVSIDTLSSVELNQFSFTNTYNVECICFSAFEYKILVEDVLIAQAIQSLSKKQQDVILLSLFFEYD